MKAMYTFHLKDDDITMDYEHITTDDGDLMLVEKKKNEQEGVRSNHSSGAQSENGTDADAHGAHDQSHSDFAYWEEAFIQRVLKDDIAKEEIHHPKASEDDVGINLHTYDKEQLTFKHEKQKEGV